MHDLPLRSPLRKLWSQNALAVNVLTETLVGDTSICNCYLIKKSVHVAFAQLHGHTCIQILLQVCVHCKQILEKLI